ncbi:hypothetical protein E8E01_00995 [Methylorubrum populi]|uniref:hypothetical protein n=1 Tax=Methylorubrum populi TaxID=223967 RepID=UPI00114DFF48|nr:hypothetical protein [Methylorubrum populi]QDI79107.1 hypothetical protein E8E01_00995 [Methylorubrum populi]
MTRFLAQLLYLAVVVYVIVSPTLAMELTGSQPIGQFVAAANFALIIAWAILTGSIRIEVSFGASPKPRAPYPELTPGAMIELPAGKAAAMARSTADIKTAFSAEGVAGVEAASRG